MTLMIWIFLIASLIVIWVAWRLVSINAPTHPALMAQALYRYSATLPCRLIHRDGGERYLERYAAGSAFGMTAYLHRFVSEDADDWLHDHPWAWSIAIVLTGGYEEERLVWFDVERGWKAKTRRIGGLRRINIIRGGDFHRIARCHPETWTLFIHSPRVKTWGFLQRAPFCVNYYQPYAVHKTAGWVAGSPLGRDADRAPPRAY